MATNDLHSIDIATPPGKPSGFGGLLTSQGLTGWAARAGICLARLKGGPLSIGKTVIAARYCDVTDMFARDLDFLIQPTNGPGFETIDFRFVLGMDRSGELARERAALYKALVRVDMAKLELKALHSVHEAIAAANGVIDVVEDYARPIAAGTAQALYGIHPSDFGQLMDAARAVFYFCFFNANQEKPTETRAVAAAGLMTQWFNDEIAKRRKSGIHGDDMMGGLLDQPDVTDDQVRRTLGGMFVGSIDPIAGATARIISVMMADDDLRAKATRDANNLPALNQWCLEAMRRWPNGPIVARHAAQDTMLGGVAIPAGTTVIGWTQAAMYDPAAFPEPKVIRNDRAAASYLHYGGGLHPCAGRGVNAWQLPLLVGQLLKHSPTKLGKMAWAGPFPAHLTLHLSGAKS